MKNGGRRGQLLLTRHATKHVYPERSSRVKDLSRIPFIPRGSGSAPFLQPSTVDCQPPVRWSSTEHGPRITEHSFNRTNLSRPPESPEGSAAAWTSAC